MCVRRELLASKNTGRGKSTRAAQVACCRSGFADGRAGRVVRPPQYPATDVAPENNAREGQPVRTAAPRARYRIQGWNHSAHPEAVRLDGRSFQIFLRQYT